MEFRVLYRTCVCMNFLFPVIIRLLGVAYPLVSWLNEGDGRWDYFFQRAGLAGNFLPVGPGNLFIYFASRAQRRGFFCFSCRRSLDLRCLASCFLRFIFCGLSEEGL